MNTYNPTLWVEGAKTALIEASSLAEPSMVGEIASRETSDKPSEIYAWIGDAFAMEALRDELVARGLSDASYSVSNNTFAIGIEVHKVHLKDDKLGMILQRVRDAGVVAMNFPNKILIEALVNGTSLTGFDGVSFFNNTHPARGLGTAFDNLDAGTGVTVAAIRTDLAAIITAAASVTNEAGEPFPSSRMKWDIVCPVAMYFDFVEALRAPLLSSTSNVRFSDLDIKLRASPRLADTSDWYALDTAARKPLIYQEHSGVANEFLGPGSDHFVKKEKVLFKISWRGGTGYNHPGLARKVVNG